MVDARHRKLLREMRFALLSEIGARAIYDHLGRVVRDDSLRALLAELNAAGAENVATLRALMIELGARPRRTSFRRRVLARILATSSRVIGVRVVLRICMNAEETVGRWYRQYAHFFMRLGEEQRARTCEGLAVTKAQHAGALGAWVSNLRQG